MAPRVPYVNGLVYSWFHPEGKFKNGIRSTNTIAVDSSNSENIAPGSIIQREADGNAALISASSNMLGIVTKVLKPDHQPFTEGYKPTSTDAILEYVAFEDGLQIRVCEDADGGNVAASNLFCALAAQVLSGTTSDSYEPNIKAHYLLDSSTASDTDGGSVNFAIVGLWNAAQNVRSAGNTTQPLIYILEPIAAHIQSA